MSTGCQKFRPYRLLSTTNLSTHNLSALKLWTLSIYRHLIYLLFPLAQSNVFITMSALTRGKQHLRQGLEVKKFRGVFLLKNVRKSAR